MTRLSPRLLAVCSLVLAGPVWAGSPYVDRDDCDANFIAFIGADAYQFSPKHGGALGSVRLFSILSYQQAAAAQDWGRALWRLQIHPADGKTPVFTARGMASLHEPRGAVLVEHYWDGRDQAGATVPPGKYRYTFEARYLPDRLAFTGKALQYEDLAGVPGADEAYASSDELVVDYALNSEKATQLRDSAAALTACQVQQRTPLEAGFGYNFYYGSTHAHSNYSDGGQPTTSCSSGNAYGSGTLAPTGVYDYARNLAGLDFWLVNEHNHLINDSVANNNGPVTEVKVRQRYQDGRAAAAAATVDDVFVALYGMEWGVTTNADQGHVTLIETPALFGWETCTGCTGPNPECTPGSNCYFDVFTPKRYGYLTMYQRSVENPSTAGALGILAHPRSGQFDNFAFDANADEALQGIAVRSGLAFNATEDCADSNVGATDYSARWKDALNRGFHLGPVADHDSHCNNFGQGLPTRTVYLLPNAATPVLTKGALLQAHKARHFFATEDPNAQLVFASSDGHLMGDIFSSGPTITLRAAVYDPNGDAVSTLELWRGQIGGGVPASAYQSFANQSSFSVVENLASGSYYYYVHAVQADGHDLWSAPMWITYGGATDTQAPTTAITAPAAGATVSGVVSVTASASDNVGVTSVEFYLDGALKATDAASPYAWAWGSTTSTNGSHTLTSKAYDAAGNAGTSAAVSVTVNNTDTQAPATSITSPANGATVSGIVSVTASATDNVGVTSVEFYQDGALVATDAASPYAWSWDTRTAANGAHSLTSKAYDAAGNAGTSPAVSVTVNNDTQAPVTSITAPANGATVLGIVSVTASATDNVGVTSVEFYLDGVLKATDATSPYAWSWDTAAVANGAHNLTSRAYDAAGNVGVSTTVSVTVNNPLGTDISNWKLVQANSSITYFIPAGTVIPANGYAIVGRNATQAAFEAFWRAGAALPSNVAYVNTAGAFPMINGSENYTLYNAAGTKVDGKTVSMSSSAGQSLRRNDPCAAAGTTSSWTVGATSTATPGSGAGAGCAKGLVINEFSDASGTGNFIYEFVELHNDR
jgi:hypothetical protein